MDDVRYDGDLAAELAFAWLMTSLDTLPGQGRESGQPTIGLKKQSGTISE